MRSMTRLVLAGLIVTSGCDHDECDKGEAACTDSRTLTRCVAESDGFTKPELRWSSVACSQSGNHYCVELGGHSATCALDNEPDERCQANATVSWCEDNGLIVCVEGFAVVGQQCSAACRESPFGESCAVCDDGLAVAEPSCVGATGTCADNSPGVCACGYRLGGAGQPCPGDSVCIVAPEGGTPVAFCALGASPDPLCNAESADGYCDGTTAVSCSYGYAVERTDCEPQGTCSDAGTSAHCQ
jgi:hypothetical protein